MTLQTITLPSYPRIVGNLHHVSDTDIVIFAHGFLSNKYSHRFNSYLPYFHQAGFSTFAFDFSGCGESEDTPISLYQHTKDLEIVIQQLMSWGFSWISLLGNSLGGLICLRAYIPQIRTIAMTGGVTGKLGHSYNAFFDKHNIRTVEGTPYLLARGVSNLRQKIVIDPKMYTEFMQIDQPALLAPIQCPVLMVHGDDAEEQELCAISQQALPQLPTGSRLTIIPGAGHRFVGFIEETAELLVTWFSAHR